MDKLVIGYSSIFLWLILYKILIIKSWILIINFRYQLINVLNLNTYMCLKVACR